MKRLLLLSPFLILPYFLLAQNVGIGTNTPQSTLDVKGNQRIGGASSYTSFDSLSGKILWKNSNLYVPSSQQLIQHSASAEGLFYNDGQIEYRDQNGNPVFFTNWTNGKGYFKSDLGIGVLTPSAKLHVGGNVKADTIIPTAIRLVPNAGAGKILTSDGAGNASWQARTGNASVGFGSWGDCSMNNISEYNPVSDSTASVYNFLGYSVAVSGDFAIAGAYGDDAGGHHDQGSASIYQFNGTNWVFMQKIFDPTGDESDYFGYSVAISGNYAIVGAHVDDVIGTDQGSACIFWYNGTSWVFQQKISDPSGASYNHFGCSVSISGSYAIIGAMLDHGNKGTASVYRYNGSNWVLQQKLSDPGGSSFQLFGFSVSIAGDRIIVGAPQDVTTAYAGSATIYFLNGSTWEVSQKIVSGVPSYIDFGLAVAISGNYCIIGSPREMGANGQGAARFYHYNGTGWELMQKFTPVNGGSMDNYGGSVCISGQYAMVGAPGTKVNLNDGQGNAVMYTRIGSGWQKLQLVTDPGGNLSDNLGASVSIDAASLRFMIGASGFASVSGKAIFGKIN